MKKWSLILALFLCLIAVGGLAVAFRLGKESTPTDKNNNSTVGNDSSYNENIDGIDLNETSLIF
jgi:hypothetical protein